MTTKNTTTAALILVVLALVSGATIPMAIPTYAQLSDVDNIVEDTLDSAGITEGEEEELVDSNIEQPVDQQAGQQLEQSEDFDSTSTNAQIQSGVEDQGITQGIEDGDDLAESSSESGDAKKKYSSSSSSSGDAQNLNEQVAANVGELNHDQEQTVDQDHAANFGDDEADLDDANVAIPIAVPIAVPIGVPIAVDQPTPPTEEPPTEEPPTEEPPPPAAFCVVVESDFAEIGVDVYCLATLEECQALQEQETREILQECFHAIAS